MHGRVFESALSRRLIASIDRHPTPNLGGARRDRTDDLLLAKQALSQLSYGPVEGALNKVVGLGRLELPTSRLSSARSNQLSYKPPKPQGRETPQPKDRPAFIPNG